MAGAIQATMVGNLHHSSIMRDDDTGMDSMITTYNTALTDTASEILGQECRRKKPWVTRDVLDLCDERRELKKRRYEVE